MIDLDKIEAAAKDAPYEAAWRYEPTGQTVWAGNTYMVADIRGWGHLQYMLNGEKLQDATGVHIATANPATVLELVRMIRERDTFRKECESVLKQALYLIESWDRGCDHDDYYRDTSEAIKAIKEILK